ncbi:hypothetical protein BGW38_003717 [Lunasporangiospora selenospora]|uniref:Nudix hydrolase domain-containing protein n=1 Tax=Lunasporangiospora selenospora TaxID=979761 RepID=A0A9P6KGX3_9FUNG|nr:hypothetical protein BGW38_003717 [Lunasporangiospora selenospora]
MVFPGGKRDPTDESVLHTALREMQEEIFIDPSVVEVLGEYSPIPNQGCTLKVHPFVGLIKQPIQDIEKDIRFNPDEVQRVFSVPMEHFMDPTKRLMVQFRNSKLLYPTWKIDDPAITIWGLTAFILDGVLRCIAKGGPVDAEEIKEGMDVKQYKPSKPSAFV